MRAPASCPRRARRGRARAPAAAGGARAEPPGCSQTLPPHNPRPPTPQPPPDSATGHSMRPRQGQCWSWRAFAGVRTRRTCASACTYLPCRTCWAGASGGTRHTRTVAAPGASCRTCPGTAPTQALHAAASLPVSSPWLGASKATQALSARAAGGRTRHCTCRATPRASITAPASAQHSSVCQAQKRGREFD
eukprot:3496540-Rhodomonas_salina.1